MGKKKGIIDVFSDTDGLREIACEIKNSNQSIRDSFEKNLELL